MLIRIKCFTVFKFLWAILFHLTIFWLKTVRRPSRIIAKYCSIIARIEYDTSREGSSLLNFFSCSFLMYSNHGGSEYALNINLSPTWFESVPPDLLYWRPRLRLCATKSKEFSHRIPKTKSGSFGFYIASNSTYLFSL